jgi:membrane-associated phospholipid phosphatase
LRLKIFSVLLMLIFPSAKLMASDQDDKMPVFKDLFHNMDQNLWHSFSNGYGLYHLAAAGLSYGLIKGGADWDYHSFMQENQAIPRAGFAGVIAGGLIPLTVPFFLYFKGKSVQDARLMYTGLALGQAAMNGLLITSTYKTFTGRKPPHDLNNNRMEQDYSDDFNFGFMRRGIFDGWPSGHTTNAFAMAAVLWEMYPENQQLKIYSGAYAFFIGLSVSTNIHWFSDFVAGALIGYSIGKSVGQSFKNLSEGKTDDNGTAFLITPQGIQITYRF